MYLCLCALLQEELTWSLTRTQILAPTRTLMVEMQAQDRLLDHVRSVALDTLLEDKHGSERWELYFLH